MEGQYTWKFSPWQTNPTREQTNAIDYEKENPTRFSVSPILPGTGNVTHNVTRMLGNQDAMPFSTYSTNHLMALRQNLAQQERSSHNTDSNHDTSSSDVSASDMSTSTERSISPYSSGSVTPPPPTGNNSSKNNTPSSVIVSPLVATPSTDDSYSFDSTPSSGASSPSGESLTSRSASSPELPSSEHGTYKKQTGEQTTKKARTNFTNEQIKTLLKIFVETPYPDSEIMENIAKDLNIKEKQVKIWFQNKRARSRRRINANNQQSFVPTTQVPFGYMPAGHMMTSSPLQNYPLNYHMMQGYLGHYNNQQFVGQMLANQNLRHHQIANQNLAVSSIATSALSTSRAPTMSSAQYGMTLPQQNSPNQNRQFSQYPGYMYASS